MRERDKSTKTVIASVAGVALVVFMSAVQGAEEHELTWKKQGRSTKISTAALHPEDVPGHKLTLEIFTDPIESSLGKGVQKNYAHNDYVWGTGKHSGAFVHAFEDGATAFGTYEGTTKTTVNDDGSWKADYNGTWRYARGTGRLKGVTGEGMYEGWVTPKDKLETAVGVIRY